MAIDTEVLGEVSIELGGGCSCNSPPRERADVQIVVEHPGDQTQAGKQHPGREVATNATS